MGNSKNFITKSENKTLNYKNGELNITEIENIQRFSDIANIDKIEEIKQIFITTEKNYVVGKKENNLTYQEVENIFKSFICENYIKLYKPTKKIYTNDLIKIEDENIVYRIVNLRNIKNFDIEKYKKYGAINIHINKTEKYNSILNFIEDKKTLIENRALLEGLSPCYPYLLREKIEQLNEFGYADSFDVDVKIVIKTKSEHIEQLTKELIDKLEVDGMSGEVLYQRHILKNFIHILPLGQNNYGSKNIFIKNNEVLMIELNEDKMEDINVFSKMEKIKYGFKNILKSMTDSKVQNHILIKEIFENGMVQNSDDKYSILIKIDNVSYQLAREDEKEKIFKIYTDVLNSIGSEMQYQLFVKNKNISEEKLRSALIKEHKHKNYNSKYYEEYNQYIDENIKKSQNKTTDKNIYICISLGATSPEEAKLKLERAKFDLSNQFTKIDIMIEEVNAEEKVALLYELFNPGKTYVKSYEDIRDRISPNSIKLSKNMMEIDNVYQEVLHIQKYPSMCRDTFLTEILNCPFSLYISIHLYPIEGHKAMELVSNKITGMESNSFDYKKKNKGSMPYRLKMQIDEAKKLRDELQINNKKMFEQGFYILVQAATKNEIETKVSIILKIAERNLFKIKPLTHRQKDGLMTVLPICNDSVEDKRTLLSDSAAIFIPFSSAEVFDEENGIYYGTNNEKQLIALNRMRLKNPSGFILGVPGSGKSMAAKKEMISAILSTDADIIVIDPEREYTRIVKAFNGETIRISVDSPHHINPMEITTMDYEDGEDPIRRKIEFITTLVENLSGNLDSREKSILDRCIRNVYLKSNDYKTVTLLKLYNEIEEQKDESAEDILLALERYTTGTYDLFAYETNINAQNRIICFDILDLGAQLKSAGMLVALEFIWGRLVENRKKGKHTYIYLDEIYLLFNNEDSAEFVFQLYKRARKYGGIATGITQNIEDLLRSSKARTMLANTEFKIILNQASTDLIEISKLLKLSEYQKAYITHAEAGNGLIFVGKDVIPFNDTFPKRTALYNLMTTKINEIVEE